MNERRPFEDGDGFEEAYRKWGRRPPRISAQAAADHLIRRLDKRPRVPQWSVFAAAAAILAVAVGGWWLIEARQARRTEEMLMASAAQIDQNVVLSWLDSGVPVYFVITTTDSKKGGER